MLRRAKPLADPQNPGQFLPNGARAKSGLNRSISDAGWGQFVSILRAKAEDAGRAWIEVDPRHTSDRCESCGMQQRRIASRKQISCGPREPGCQADEHAARNLYGLDWPSRAPRERSRRLPAVGESGLCSIASNGCWRASRARVVTDQPVSSPADAFLGVAERPAVDLRFRSRDRRVEELARQQPPRSIGRAAVRLRRGHRQVAQICCERSAPGLVEAGIDGLE